MKGAGMRKVYFLAFFSLLVFLFSLSSFSSKIYAEAEKVNYELPYPGLLPDNSLYFLRATRDRIVSFLISDPLKKAEFNLLQADKRLNAGIYLITKGKISLALSTVSKAENYFEEALRKIEEAKAQGMSISELEERLRDSAKKHKQELGNIINKVSKDFKASFEKEQERLKDFSERLGS